VAGGRRLGPRPRGDRGVFLVAALGGAPPRPGRVGATAGADHLAVPQHRAGRRLRRRPTVCGLPPRLPSILLPTPDGPQPVTCRPFLRKPAGTSPGPSSRAAFTAIARRRSRLRE